MSQQSGLPEAASRFDPFDQPALVVEIPETPQNGQNRVRRQVGTVAAYWLVQTNLIGGTT